MKRKTLQGRVAALLGSVMLASFSPLSAYAAISEDSPREDISDLNEEEEDGDSSNQASEIFSENKEKEAGDSEGDAGILSGDEVSEGDGFEGNGSDQGEKVPAREAWDDAQAEGKSEDKGIKDYEKTESDGFGSNDPSGNDEDEGEDGGEVEGDTELSGTTALANAGNINDESLDNGASDGSGHADEVSGSDEATFDAVADEYNESDITDEAAFGGASDEDGELDFADVASGSDEAAFDTASGEGEAVPAFDAALGDGKAVSDDVDDTAVADEDGAVEPESIENTEDAVDTEGSEDGAAEALSQGGELSGVTKEREADAAEDADDPEADEEIKDESETDDVKTADAQVASSEAEEADDMESKDAEAEEANDAEVEAAEAGEADDAEVEAEEAEEADDAEVEAEEAGEADEAENVETEEANNAESKAAEAEEDEAGDAEAVSEAEDARTVGEDWSSADGLVDLSLMDGLVDEEAAVREEGQLFSEEGDLANENLYTIPLEGTVCTESMETILERINEIRLEACKEGLINPDNKSVKLTEADYVPIQWSSGLEKIALQRAAEGCVVMGHDRPRGGDCFTCVMDGVRTWAENLAWNSTGLMYGIEQWYSEKDAYVNQTPGAVTGHYTSLINPNYKYVGISAFKPESGFTTVAGEFSFETGLEESKVYENGAKTINVEVPKDQLSIILSGPSSINRGKQDSFEAYYALKGEQTAVLLKGASFTSSDTSVLSIDDDGLAQALKAGSVTVSAEYDGFSASLEVTVKEPVISVTGVKIAETMFTLKKGESRTLTVTVSPENASNKAVTYVSNNEEVASVNNGKVSALRPGGAVITVRTVDGGRADSCGVTVTGSIGDADVSLSENSFVYDGKAKTPALTVTYDGEVLTEGTDYTTMYYLNVNAGDARIVISGRKYYEGEKTVSFRIEPAAVAVTGVELSAAKLSLEKGESAELSATVSPADAAEKAVRFSSSNEKVASVKNGKVTAVAPGRAIIEATTVDGGKTASCTVTVTGNLADASVSLSGDAFIYDGTAQTPAVTVTYDGKTLKSGTDYTVAYSSNINAGRATAKISGKGYYTGAKAVSFEIGKASQTLKISEPANKARVSVGTKLNIKADGAQGGLTYKSGSTGIATVNQNGVVSARKVGTVKITVSAAATDNYKAASKALTLRVTPAKTSSLTVTNTAKGVRLAWKKVAGATGYYVYRNGKQVKKITKAAAVTYTDTGAKTNGTKYQYVVYAFANTGK